MSAGALVLIGFMGTGKSSAGREVAERLRLERFDTDEMVTRRFGMPVTRIFRDFGEAAFREAETEALASIPAGPSIVIPGGGAILTDVNRAHCRRLGTIAWLTADEETIFRRVSRRPSRPLLQTENPRATLAELLAARQTLYRELADFEIDTTSLDHAAAASALIARWHALVPDAFGAPENP